MSGDLEAQLISTESIGELSLFKLSGGWRASIELPAPAGCQAKVSSDIDCPTPSAAVDQMIERLANLRRTVGAKDLRLAG
jgi:hypothetical protein